jgi:hypothetical protein
MSTKTTIRAITMRAVLLAIGITLGRGRSRRGYA